MSDIVFRDVLQCNCDCQLVPFLKVTLLKLTYHYYFSQGSVGMSCQSKPNTFRKTVQPLAPESSTNNRCGPNIHKENKDPGKLESQSSTASALHFIVWEREERASDMSYKACNMNDKEIALKPQQSPLAPIWMDDSNYCHWTKCL